MTNNITIKNVFSDRNIQRNLSSNLNTFDSWESIYSLNVFETKTNLQLDLRNSDDSNLEFSQLDLIEDFDIEPENVAIDDEELSLVSSNDSNLLTDNNIIATSSSFITYTNIFGDDNDRLIKGDIEDNNIIGWIGDDTIFGDLGDDLIRGHRGDDILYGDGGDDRLVGNDGNDILDGGAGNNVLIDDSGSNIFVLSDVGFSRIIHFDLGQDTIGLSNGISYDDLRFAGLNNTKIFYERNSIGFIKGVSSSEISADNFSKIF